MVRLHYKDGKYVDGDGVAQKVLHIPMNGEYWCEIKAGSKPFEYRLCDDRWKKILSKEYDYVFFKYGYPSRENWNKIIVEPYRGFEVQSIVHPLFGEEAVKVFAIYTGGSIVKF